MRTELELYAEYTAKYRRHQSCTGDYYYTVEFDDTNGNQISIKLPDIDEFKKLLTEES